MINLQWEKRLKAKLRQKPLRFRLEYYLLRFFKSDALEEYCIDNDILHDYYNEEPEHEDRWMDLD